MLPKEKRLNLKKDFKWVASGEKKDDTFLRIFLKFGNNKDPRVGIALSKATFKKAVDRNKSRRMVSTAIQSLYFDLPAGINIVIMPRQGVLDMTIEDLTKILKKHLLKE